MLCLEATVEVMRAKVLIGGSILEHVVDGGEDGSGDRHDYLDDALAEHMVTNAQIAASKHSRRVRPCRRRLAKSRGEKSLEGTISWRPLIVSLDRFTSSAGQKSRGRVSITGESILVELHTVARIRAIPRGMDFDAQKINGTLVAKRPEVLRELPKPGCGGWRWRSLQ